MTPVRGSSGRGSSGRGSSGRGRRPRPSCTCAPTPGSARATWRSSWTRSLGGGVDIVQLRQKGLEAGRRAALPGDLPPGLRQARRAAGGQRPGRRRLRGRRRRTAPGPGRPAGAVGPRDPRCRTSLIGLSTPRRAAGGGGRHRAGRRLLLHRAGVADADQARPARLPGLGLVWYAAGRWRHRPARGSPSAASTSATWTRCWTPGPAGSSWSGRSPRRTIRPPPQPPWRPASAPPGSAPFHDLVVLSVLGADRTTRSWKRAVVRICRRTVNLSIMSRNRPPQAPAIRELLEAGLPSFSFEFMPPQDRRGRGGSCGCPSASWSRCGRRSCR